MSEGVSFDKAVLAWTLPWEDGVTAVRFLGPTRRIAAGNNRGQILLWELPEKTGVPAPLPSRWLRGHENVVTRLAATADGRWLISASYDHTVRYWDMQAQPTGSETLLLNQRGKTPLAIEAKVGIQESARTLQGHHDWVQALALSPDDRLLLSGDDQGEIIVWDRAAGKEQQRWKLKGWAYAAALAPDNSQALISERVPLIFDSGRSDGVKLYDLATGRVTHDLSSQCKGMHLAAAAFSFDGKLLALGRGGELDGPQAKVFLMDPASGKKVRELTPGHQKGVLDLAFHPDGRHLASSGRDTTIRIWNLADGKLVKELSKPRGAQTKDWFTGISFSADGLWLAAGDMSGCIQVWSFDG